MLLEFATQAEARGDVFVDFDADIDTDEVRDALGLVNLITAFGAVEDAGLLKLHLDNLPDGVLTVAAFGTHLFDVAVSAAVNRTIEVGEANRRLDALEEAINGSVPDDDAWAEAFELAREDIKAMTDDNALRNWGKAVEQNLDEMAQTVAKLVTTKVATKVAVNAAAKAVAGKFVIATAPVSLTVGIVVYVVYHIIDQTDKFWDHVTYSSVAAQVYMISYQHGITDMLDYTKFAFYKHLKIASEVTILLTNLAGYDRPNHHQKAILERRDLALREVLDSISWSPVDDFNTLKEAGNTAPRGLWSDGNTMWVSDRTDDKIYAYDMESKGRVPGKDIDLCPGFICSNGAATGIWSDETTMWVADRGDHRIYAYDMTSDDRDRSKEFDTLGTERFIFPHGIWSDNTTMWVARENSSTIHAYHMSSKMRDVSRDLDTSEVTGNRRSGKALFGIWGTGNTMWVGDSRDDKLYGYNIEANTRDETREIGLIDVRKLVDNGAPAGIWSDGTTMWVVDSDEHKIYAYTIPEPIEVPESGGCFQSLGTLTAQVTRAGEWSSDCELRRAG